MYNGKRVDRKYLLQCHIVFENNCRLNHKVNCTRYLIVINEEKEYYHSNNRDIQSSIILSYFYGETYFFI